MTLAEYTKTAKDNLASIPAEYRLILDDLLQAESGKLHRNTGETDITTGTGIYRASSPNAEVFKYIELVAGKGNTSSWDATTIANVNTLLDPDVIYYYSYLFYSNYYKELDLSLFPDEVIVDICNLYANSPQGAKLAITRGAINLYKIGSVQLTPDEVFEPVDKIGPKTINLLKKIRDASHEVHMTFIMSLMFEMQQYYCAIVTSDKEKVAKASEIINSLRFLNGWGNRLDNRLSARVKGK